MTQPCRSGLSFAMFAAQVPGFSDLSVRQKELGFEMLKIWEEMEKSVAEKYGEMQQWGK